MTVAMASCQGIVFCWGTRSMKNETCPSPRCQPHLPQFPLQVTSTGTFQLSLSPNHCLCPHSPGSPLHKQASAPTVAVPAASEKPGPKAAEVGDDFVGDFEVGERVWVNGVKPGVVQYLGETQFAPGQWAGVVLDEPVGKNDGAVGGVRYFECPALQGIFTRPSKLTRQPTAEGSGSDTHSVESLTAQNLSLHSGTATPPLTSRVIPLRESVLNSSVKTGNESGSNLSDSGSVKRGDKDLRLGDRVLVSPFPPLLHRTRQAGTRGCQGGGPGWVTHSMLEPHRGTRETG